MPSLNLFSQGNGYNPDRNQSSKYPPSFISRYTQAEGQREADLVSAAQRLEKQSTEGRGGGASDNTAFPVAHDAARIWQQDTSLLSHTKGTHLLITPTSPNGKLQVVHSMRVPSDSPVPSSPQADDSAPTDYPQHLLVGRRDQGTRLPPDRRFDRGCRVGFLQRLDGHHCSRHRRSFAHDVNVSALLGRAVGDVLPSCAEVEGQDARVRRGGEHTFNSCTICENLTQCIRRHRN